MEKLREFCGECHRYDGDHSPLCSRAGYIAPLGQCCPRAEDSKKFLHTGKLPRYGMGERELPYEFTAAATTVTVDIQSIYGETAKLAELDTYIEKALALAGDGNDIVITGAGPVWLYLKIAHALHGKARKLSYSSPVTGDVVICEEGYTVSPLPTCRECGQETRRTPIGEEY